ncbi:molybdopterin-dependent oxidoreductase [Rhodoferax sp.]|uniref:molybdopterin-dependent oxidoreductase n=1 Tax=Rhodoferax sp. TaxID=50421 RepID=UPI002ACECBA9|nr:molybdopterin-dependent oxidoreductase [Rhodoferax sp.]MDZ7920113.1 molybdopterin-dependent oxidoreductase [Rhodoferax sp.]
MKSVKSMYKAAVSFTIAGLLGFCLAQAPAAWALDVPTEPVVLTVSGQVSITNAGKTAVFSMAMLAKLPQRTVVTKSPWYPAGAEFTGPLLRDVLAAAGAKGNKIVAVALNDYKTDIPFDDATQHDVILARLMNGKPMPVREKGPLFVVYPLDAKPELQSQIYYNRSAWQLARLIVQ